MKDKILFWIDTNLAEFGIAKFLEQRNIFDLFAIYDINYPLNQSFKNQNIVTFQKEWFFWEHVLEIKKDIDTKYLKGFEDKYQIQLWNLVYTERIFYKYNPFYKFKKNEILSILEQECKFFEYVLDEIKPNFLIIKITDFHRNHLLAEMCKKKGIKVLTLVPTRIGNRATIVSDVNKFDETWETILEEHTDENFSIEKYLKLHDRVKQTKKIVSGGIKFPLNKKINVAYKWITETFDEKYKKSYDRKGVTRIKAGCIFVKNILKSKIRRSFIDKKFIHEIIEEKFIFFPLQVVPERTVSLDAPYYSNQISVITNIAKSIPIDYKLYVKEHFSMEARNWRSISEYKQIMELPNVRIIHPSISAEKIIKKSKLTIAISSTAGMEAAYYKKPAIIFSDTIYSKLSSITRINNYENLRDEIKNSLARENDYLDLENFIKIMDKNTFEFDAFDLYSRFTKRFHNWGFLQASEIKMSELETFLVEQRGILEKCVEEFLKVITKYKKLRNN